MAANTIVVNQQHPLVDALDQVWRVLTGGAKNVRSANVRPNTFNPPTPSLNPYMYATGESPPVANVNPIGTGPSSMSGGPPWNLMTISPSDPNYPQIQALYGQGDPTKSGGAWGGAGIGYAPPPVHPSGGGAPPPRGHPPPVHGGLGGGAGAYGYNPLPGGSFTTTIGGTPPGYETGANPGFSSTPLGPYTPPSGLDPNTGLPVGAPAGVNYIPTLGPGTTFGGPSLGVTQLPTNYQIGSVIYGPGGTMTIA